MVRVGRAGRGVGRRARAGRGALRRGAVRWGRVLSWEEALGSAATVPRRPLRTARSRPIPAPLRATLRCAAPHCAPHMT